MQHSKASKRNGCATNDGIAYLGCSSSVVAWLLLSCSLLAGPLDQRCNIADGLLSGCWGSVGGLLAVCYPLLVAALIQSSSTAQYLVEHMRSSSQARMQPLFNIRCTSAPRRQAHVEQDCTDRDKLKFLPASPASWQSLHG